MALKVALAVVLIGALFSIVAPHRVLAFRRRILGRLHIPDPVYQALRGPFIVRAGGLAIVAMAALWWFLWCFE
jgi:hypothetical protein